MSWHRRARHAFAHSLRVRLMALFVLLALAMAGVFVGAMQYALGIGWRDAARPLVADYVDHLAADLGTPPNVERAQALVQRLPLRISIRGPLVNWESDSARPDYRTYDHQHGEPMDRLLERNTADGHHIAFALSVPSWDEPHRHLGWTTLAVLLLLIALAYWRVRKWLRPLDAIRAGALRFGAGDFTQPIAVERAHNPDELGVLARTINTMAEDIAQMLEAKRSLLLSISHELRSPLTRARLHTELLPETEQVQPAREALLRDLALMRDLVTDLLESERLASRHAALHREPVDMRALVADAAQSMDQEVQQDLAPNLPLLHLDPVRMRLLLRNLLDNACRYSAGAPQAPIVTLRAGEQGGLELSVRDFGPGVPSEQIAALAQPFYRPDTARTREGGGVGLGLYLCKLVALAHGGSFTIAPANPGLQVCVVLPRQS